MNLLEAVRSGRRFKRLGWDKWATATDTLQDDTPIFYLEDFFVEDWEVESEPEQSITVTKTQFFTAVADLLKLYERDIELSYASRDLAKNLGFKLSDL